MAHRLKKAILLFLPLLLLVLAMIHNRDDLIEAEEPQRDADVIFVLGSPAADDGSPGDVMRTRVEKGVALLQAGYAPRIVFQGGAVKNDYVEAQVMADYARALGIDEDALYLEEKSRDTIENVEEALKLMNEKGWRRAIVVTSSYHSRRAGRLFASRGTDVTMVVADYPADWSLLQRVGTIIHEYLLMGWYRLCGVA